MGTGTSMAGQAMAGSFFSRFAQLGAIYAHLVCVLIPKLNSGRLLYMVAVLQNSNLGGPKIQFFLG